MPAPENNENAKKHGLRSYEERGEVALDQAGRSRTAELREQVQTRAGLVDLLKERAARACMIAEMAEGWISRQSAEGRTPDQIGMLGRVTTYQANAQRAIVALLEVLPKDEAIDVSEIQREFRGKDAPDN